MTAKEVYEKMILGETRPEDALSFFNSKRQELLAAEEKQKKLYQLGLADAATQEQFEKDLQKAIESGDQKRILEADEALRCFKIEKDYADSLLLDSYIEATNEMIEKQKNETPPEDIKAIKQTIPNEEISCNEIGIIKYIKDEGQIEKNPDDKGKYNLIGKAENFIHWFIYNNFNRYENFSFLPNFMMKYINHSCTLETLKRYVRNARRIVPSQLKSEPEMRSLKEIR